MGNFKKPKARVFIIADGAPNRKVYIPVTQWLRLRVVDGVQSTRLTLLTGESVIAYEEEGKTARFTTIEGDAVEFTNFTCYGDYESAKLVCEQHEFASYKRIVETRKKELGEKLLADDSSIDEHCPHCEALVSIAYSKQRCPSCGETILACSMCKCENCAECQQTAGAGFELDV